VTTEVRTAAGDADNAVARRLIRYLALDLSG